jgi:hypothetical protein
VAYRVSRISEWTRHMFNNLALCVSTIDPRLGGSQV